MPWTHISSPDVWKVALLTIDSTGATGYTGGTVFNTLVTAHPEYDITVVLRDPTESFSKKYPNIKILRGDFDSGDLLRQAASEANIVVRMSSPRETPTNSG